MIKKFLKLLCGNPHGNPAPANFVRPVVTKSPNKPMMINNWIILRTIPGAKNPFLEK